MPFDLSLQRNARTIVTRPKPPSRAFGRRAALKSRARRLRLEPLEDRRLLVATAVGEEFRINLAASGVQRFGAGSDAVGVDAYGGMVAIYSGTGANKTTEIFGQRYSADGSAVGGQFTLNQLVSGNQDGASVAVRRDASFVVVWSGKGTGDSSGVFFRRFDANGTPLASDQRANSTTKGVQSQPSIAVAADGRFVIAWSGKGPGDSNGVYLRWFSPEGAPLSSEIRVNTTTTGTQNQPDVSVAADGSYAVAWSGTGSSDSAGVFVQRFAADGSRIGGETRVNQTTKGTQQIADVLVEQDGSVVTIWSGAGVGDSAGVFWRKLDAGGQFTGGETRVNMATQGAQQSPALAAVGDGSYFVVWAGQRFERGRFKSWDVLSQQLDAGGQRLAAAQAANVATQGLQYSPSVASNGRGQLVAAWSGMGPGDTAGVFARRFAADIQPEGLFIADVGLSAASDSGAAGDRKTNAGRVVLTGQTQPLATLKLLETGAEALANQDGLFQFPGVDLAFGLNAFTVEATNAAGQTARRTVTIERLAETTGVDPVLRWNQAALEAARLDAANPPYASRAYAMLHAAIYDAVAAIDGSPSYLVALPAPAGASVEAAVNAAGERILSYLWPGQQDAFGTVLTAGLAQVPDGAAEDSGVALGRAVAGAVIAVRSGDGWDEFVEAPSGDEPGEWQFTPPLHDPGLAPQWATLDPFAMDSPDQFRPDGPPPLTSQEWADAYSEVKSLGAFNSTTRIAEQTQIARFWADGPGTFTPPGHWNQIAAQFAQEAGNSIAENARLFAMLNIAQADAAIASWDAKYAYDFWRPVTAIQAGDADGNDLTAADATWQPLLITPPFPEYTSGHSTFSGAAAGILTAVFGGDRPFNATSQSLPNVTRTFSSFQAAAWEASRSRIYGGIHYAFSGDDGLAAGAAVAEQVLARFSASRDHGPPQVILERPASGVVTATNFTLSGRVLDNLSGVALLEAQLDGGGFAPVNFNSLGQFGIPTQFSLGGLADGPHAFGLRATDAVGNISDLLEFSFTLDTHTPLIALDAPAAGEIVSAGAHLGGNASGTGSPLVQLQYTLDGGAPIPLPFTSGGQFAAPLALSQLAPGQHTLVISARDAAGLTATLSRSFRLDAAIPLAILEHAPLDGANEVGTTYRPRISFSRPVDPATLTAANFYATAPSGDKIAAKIVPATDGTFAWLFFAEPLPGGARITVHVDGASILPAAGGEALDADGDGAAGGTLEFPFTTVSRTPLVGTTLSGRVFDAGPDLKPMTFDDFRAGPDGALFTADDVFLMPIATAKVFIVGLEDQPVFTDAQGNFHFDAAPAGNVKLAIDGRTATNAPAGFFFPEMVMDQFLEAGRANTVMGTMGDLADREAFRNRTEVYLPRLQSSILHTIAGAAPQTIGVDAQSAPDLAPDERQFLTLQVSPGSLLDEHGNALSSGQVGISTVPPELVREMLPPGVMQLSTTMTIQAPGIASFAQPLRMTFPNTYDAPPGSQLSFYSFDHTTGRLVVEGTATVSPDGQFATTDPGSGITHPGWHGLTPPGGPAGPDDDEPLSCSVPAAGLGGAEGESTSKFVIERTRLSHGETPSQSVNDFLFTANDDVGLISFTSIPPCGRMQFQVTVEDKQTAKAFMKGLKNTTITLNPGDSQAISIFPKAFEWKGPNVPHKPKDPYNLRNVANDRLYGVKVSIKVSEQLGGKGPYVPVAEQPKPFYVYRFVDSGDSDSSDGTLDFAPVLADGKGGATTRRVIDIRGNAEITKTGFTFLDPLHFGGHRESDRQRIAFFDPQAIDEFIGSTLTVETPGPNPRVAGTLALRGEGSEKLRVFIDKAGLDQVLATLANPATPQNGRITFNERALFDTPEKRLALIQEVENGIQGKLLSFAKGIEFTPVAATAFLDINWQINPGLFKLGESRGDTLATQAQELKLLAADSDLYNNRSLAYRLTRILAAPKAGTAAVNVDDLLEGGGSIPYDLSRDELINGLVMIATHEAGHAFGLMHTAELGVVDQSNEVQELAITPGNPADRFVLGFAGEFGSRQLAADATTSDIAQALGELTTFTARVTNNFLVTGAPGGPFTIQFVDAATPPGAPSRFRGTNAPLLQWRSAQAGALSVAIHTVQDGGSLQTVNISRTVDGLDSSADLMAGGYWVDLVGDKAFTPQFSSPALQLATFNYENLQSQSARDFSDLINFATTIPVGHLDLGLDPESTTPPVQPAALGVGPRLMVLLDGASLGAEPLDFGVVNDPGLESVTRRLTLVNFGAADTLVRGVRVTQGSDWFSVPAIPVTTLRSGESLEVEVTFQAQGGVSATGFLVIDTDALAFSGGVELIGSGQQADEPEIRAVFELNNLGGVEVGETTTLSALNLLRLGAEGGELPTIFNNGTQPLTISEIRTLAGQGEYFLSPQAFPVVVPPGESFAFDFNVRFSITGLRPGVLEIVSDDPQSPLVRLPLVGTGVTFEANVGFPNLDVGNDYVAVSQAETGAAAAPVLRTRSDDGGNWEFFLPPETNMEIVTFDPVSGLVAHGYVTTNPTGQRTEFLVGEFLPSEAPDTDGDGLPDDVELALGTAADKTDTDGDGRSDFAELASGQNPSDNRPAVTGVVAGLATPAQAMDVEIANEFAGSGRTLAFVAAFGQGLVIADVSRSDQPTLLRQLQLPGVALEVDVDGVQGIAAVSAGEAGLHLVDISDAARPRLLRTIPGDAQSAEIFESLVYVGGANGITAADLRTGERLENLTLGGGVQGLTRDGTMLYATVSTGLNHSLRTIDLAGVEMATRGSLDLPALARRVYVADAVAWVGTGQGLLTIDVSQPENLRTLFNNNQLPLIGDVALDGAGLGVLTSTGILQLAIVQTNDPAAQLPTVTQLGLPGRERAVAIQGGLAYVATEVGLQVVSLPIIAATSLPPDLALEVANPDVEPRPGLQLPAGAIVNFRTRIQGDFRTSRVELLMDGRVIASDASFPFDFAARLPAVATAGTLVAFQLRATSREGDVILSNEVVIEPPPDQTAPTIVQLNPADGSTHDDGFNRVFVRFSEPLDPATVTAANIELLGPAGPIAPTVVSVRQDASLLDLRYPPLADGDYQIVFHAAAIADRVGNPLGIGDIFTTFRVAAPPPPATSAEILAGRHTQVINVQTMGQLGAVADFNRDGRLDVAFPAGNITFLNGLPTPHLPVLLGQGDGTFQMSPGSPGISGASIHVVSADFNNDGLEDLATAAVDHLAVFLGNGDGTFQPAINTTALPSAMFLAPGDFNRDGSLDLAVGTGLCCNQDVFPTAGQISIYFGNGSGSFTVSPNAFDSISGTLGPNNDALRFAGFAARDFDGDGNLDIVAADPVNGAIHVFRGQPSGLFAREPLNPGRMIVSTTMLPGGGQFLATGDYSGDGRLDVAVTGGDAVHVLLGNGDATFQPPTSYPAPGALDIVAADYNRDGRLDLIASHLGSLDRAITPTPPDFRGGTYLLLNQGGGAFTTPTLRLNVASPQHLAAGDFNGDGNADLFATAISNGATVLLGDGTGGLISAERYPTGRGPVVGINDQSIDYVSTGDLNSDGHADVVFTDRRGTINVRLGNGNGTFQPTVSYPLTATTLRPRPADLELGDINGDGNLDLAVANGGTASVNIFLGVGDGTFGPVSNIFMQPTRQFVIDLPAPNDVALADLNGDDNLDLIVGFAIGPMLVMLGDGQGSFAPVFPDPVQQPGERYHWISGFSSYQVQVEDFNGDGRMDIAGLWPKDDFDEPPSEIRILFGAGDGVNFSLGPKILAPTLSFSLTAADITGDGTLDLIAGAQSFHSVRPNLVDASVVVFEGLGDGSFEPYQQYGVRLPTSYFGVIAADVNADGRLDVVAGTDLTSTAFHLPNGIFPSQGVAVFLNQGDGTLGEPAFYDHSGQIAGSVAAADFSGDGLLDILVTNRFDDSFSILFAAPAGAPLRAAAAAPEDARHSAISPPLTAQELATLVDAAILQWATSGLGQPELDNLRRAKWHVADLPGDLLGWAAGNGVWIDHDAAGFGWYLDSTTTADEEFGNPSSSADSRMDLLTAIMHEMGHLLGLEDETNAGRSPRLMSHRLAAGLRLRP